MKYSIRRAMPIALVAALASVATAGDVGIPDNNASTGGCNVIPMNGGWPSTSNPGGEWRYQTQLNAAWIGQSGYITDIAFATCNGGPVLTATGFEIRMSHTTLAAPVSNFATNLPNPVVVYPSGSFTYTSQANQWVPLGLTNSFFYNGNDNLTIEIRYQTGTVASGSLSAHTDSSNPNAPYRTYVYGSGAYNATTASATGSRAGLKIRLTFADALITPNGTANVGQPFSFQLSAPQEAGKLFLAGSSLGEGPTPIGSRVLPLSIDNMFIASAGGKVPQVFTQYNGVLSAAGGGTVGLLIPAIPQLAGVKFFTAYVVVDQNAPQSISAISANAPVTIQP